MEGRSGGLLSWGTLTRSDSNNNENSEMVEKKNLNWFCMMFSSHDDRAIESDAHELKLKNALHLLSEVTAHFLIAIKTDIIFTMNSVCSFIGSVSCRVSAVSKFLFSG